MVILLEELIKLLNATCHTAVEGACGNPLKYVMFLGNGMVVRLYAVKRIREMGE